MAALTGVKVFDMVAGKIEKVAFEGAEYVRVDGGAEAGDIIQATESIGDTSKGSFYAVVKDEVWGGVEFLDDDNDGCSTRRTEHDLFRKVAAPPSDLESRVEALESDVAALQERAGSEVKGEKEAEEVPEKSVAQFKAGDKVRGISNGKIYTLKERDYDEDDKGHGIAWTTEESMFGWLGEDQVELVEEEKSEASLKVGDHVKVIGDTEFHDVSKGSIAKITHIVEHATHNVRFELLDGSDYDWSKPDSLEKVSAEEAEEKAKWAEIGREVDEYKEGDIVRVIDASGSCNTDGDIGEITQVDNDGTFRVETPHAKSGNFNYPESVELVTPVESRFDRQ